MHAPVSGSISLPSRVLFAFPSRYWYAIGRLRVFSLGGWSPPCSDRISRAPAPTCRKLSTTTKFFAVRGFHPLWRHFPEASANSIAITCRLFPVRSPLLWESRLISFLRLLRCFSSPGSLPHAYIFSVGYSLRSGFPHSDISGSKLHCQLPRAFRRLVRPSSPVIARHPPHALIRLIPITLSSLARPRSYRQLLCALPESTGKSMQSQPYPQPLHASKRLRLTGDTTFFHFVKEHEPRKGSGLKSLQTLQPDISQVAGGGG